MISQVITSPGPIQSSPSFVYYTGQLRATTNTGECLLYALRSLKLAYILLLPEKLAGVPIFVDIYCMTSLLPLEESSTNRVYI